MSENMAHLEDMRKRPGRKWPGILCGLMGAAAGLVAGYWIFYWLFENHGVIALALPGAMVGFGRALVLRRRSWPLAFVCGGLGLGAGLYIAADIFITPLAELSWFSKLGIAAGAAIALWLGLGRAPKTGPEPPGKFTLPE